MKKIIFPLFITALFIGACKSTQPTTTTTDPNFEEVVEYPSNVNAEAEIDTSEVIDWSLQKTPSGLEYQIIMPGFGKQPKNGDIVTVHYVGTLQDGSIFDSSRERGEPISFTLGKGQVIKGWDEGIALLKEGTQALLLIPPDLAYGEKQVGNIPANSYLVFDVELISVKEKVAPVPFDISGIEKQTTPSGLSYYIIKKGAGEKAEAGKNVSVHYSGYLEDGKMFDSSVERGQPFNFELGKGKVIKGWDEGIALLNVGSKARFIIPPDLGYGTGGFSNLIPGNATLIFDVELLDVK
ncbi:MAG: FKBP-type peptidyl-prolyl cis-trans isomerase [Bacteroidia bacterium]